VIDPLIDGVTGAQTATTQAMGARLTKLIQDSYPRYAVQPFSAATVQQGPLILIGTFTGVNADRKTEGLRESYRICFALADLKTGKLVSKGLAFRQGRRRRLQSAALLPRRAGVAGRPRHQRLHPHLPGHPRG
jgi:hypothetical protein